MTWFGSDSASPVNTTTEPQKVERPLTDRERIAQLERAVHTLVAIAIDNTRLPHAARVVDAYGHAPASLEPFRTHRDPLGHTTKKGIGSD